MDMPLVEAPGLEELPIYERRRPNTASPPLGSKSYHFQDGSTIALPKLQKSLQRRWRVVLVAVVGVGEDRHALFMKAIHEL
jgi:hypothetical protein